MAMSPFAAAGMLEVAHQLGLLPRMSDGMRHAMISGLVGYGLGQNSAPSRSSEEERIERRRAFEEAMARAQALRAQRQRDYDEHLRAVLSNAALARQAR